MEPASAIGIVTGSLTIIKAAKGLVESIKRAPSSIETLSNDLFAIESQLRRVHRIVDNDTTHEQEMYETLEGPMINCETVARKLEKLIQPCIKTNRGVTAWRRLVFGFKESEVVLLRKDLESCGRILGNAIAMANLLVSGRTERGVSRIQHHFGIATTSVAESSTGFNGTTARVQAWRAETQQFQGGTIEEETIESSKGPEPETQLGSFQTPELRPIWALSDLLKEARREAGRLEDLHPSQKTALETIQNALDDVESTLGSNNHLMDAENPLSRVYSPEVTIKAMKDVIYISDGIDPSQQELFLDGNHLYIEEYNRYEYDVDEKLRQGAKLLLFVSEGRLGDMQICIRSLTGKILSLFVRRDTTVDELKRQVRARQSYFRCNDKLEYQGKVLLDGYLLSDYGVEKGCQIHEVTADLWIQLNNTDLYYSSRWRDFCD